jgi:asparagine synthase (glutamine-hydrolysing)
MISRPSALERYFELNYTPYFLRRQLLAPEWMAPGDAAFLERAFAQCLLPNGADIVTQALYFEATAKLTGDMLVKVDRMSMAASLEVRCPLLDQELALLAAKIPHSWKLGAGKGKRILIDTLGGRLPPELLTRPKRGFGVPLYRFAGHRTQLPAWAERKGEDGLLEYQVKNNRKSIDGLRALEWANREPGIETLEPKA